MSNEKPKNQLQDFYVAGVGTSAGGIEALTSLLGSFTGDKLNLSVIVVQHLSRNHKSELTAILARQCKWPVVTAEDDATVLPRHIYVTPPNKSILYSSGKIKLDELSPNDSHAPSINEFFISLAEGEKQHAIGIILSGSGHDGAEGIMAIKEQNGFAIAQSPESAQHADMPLAAIQTGTLDLILHPSKMFEEMTYYIVNHRVIAGITPSQKSVDFIFDLLSKRSGVDFSQYKSNTMMRRIEKRIEALNVRNMSEYYQLLRQNALELDTLFDTVLIGVTEFFRDPEAFEKIKSLLNTRLRERRHNDSIRIWCVGCATGEEAYSIAILLHELLGSEIYNFQFQVFASDIGERALSFARKGIYSEKALRKIPPDLLEKYFDKNKYGFEVKKNIKQNILFSRHDITNDPPFVKLDLVVCRNLLIYFNTYLQKETLRIFNYALKEDGLLFLGKSESVSVLADLFAKTEGMKIFRKIEPPVPLNLRFSRYRMTIDARDDKSKTANRNLSLVDIAKETFYYQNKDPFIILSEQGDIKEAQGSLRLYIEINQGATNTNIFKMANKELVTEIRSLLAQGKKNNSNQITSHVIKFTLFEKQYYVRLKLTPLIYPSGGLMHYILAFEAVNPDETYLQLSRKFTDKGFEDFRIKELEQEVTSLREHLETFTEELETSNEEMQAMNEELQSANEELKSANEELETSNEELQSINEELHTSNAQLRFANNALIEKEAELKNAKNTIERNERLYRTISENIPNGIVGILNDRFEMEYTAGKGLDIYNIRLHDLLHKNPQKKGPLQAERKKLIEAFTNTLTGKSCTVEFTFEDRWYTLQTIPLNDSDSKKKVMYLTQDITNVKQNELKFITLAENIPNLCWMAKPDGAIYWYNSRWYEYTGTTLEEMEGWGWESVHDPKMLSVVKDKWESSIKERKPFEMVFPLKGKDGGYREFLTRIVPVFDNSGNLWQWFGTNTDISEREKLAKLKDEFIGIASHELKTPITSIKGYFQLMEMTLDSGGNVPFETLVKRAGKQVDKLTRLIHDLLDVSKIQAGKLEYDFSDFPIEPFLNDCVNQLSQQLNEHTIILQGDLDAKVFGDRVRLEQVVVNLISNAVKYSPNSVKVVVEASRTDHQLKICVTDFGIGIPEDLKPHVFERFFRVEKTSHNYQGMGLGLYICSEIIKRHDGKIGFDSEEGKGSVFWFTIPIAANGEII